MCFYDYMENALTMANGQTSDMVDIADKNGDSLSGCRSAVTSPRLLRDDGIYHLRRPNVWLSEL